MPALAHMTLEQIETTCGDGDVLLLFLEDFPKAAAEIDGMELFKRHPTWQEAIATALRTVDATKFTADTLVAAAQSISRRHISSEYDVTLYCSTALVVTLFEAVQLLDRVDCNSVVMPALVPLVFAEATFTAFQGLAVRPDKATLGHEIHILPPVTAHPDDETDMNLITILQRSWRSWQAS
ncbi:hypothetical protein DYB32_004939 [Aphanomyces invadans]|uniref:Uncharacterized protein n=1 Tax=Aphanomyces invadans TaxID=157072 RepID=A0A3R6ZQB6_9STRA|nr:hypothetical protein DYB32_004939 [Aphanomyces invadans]